MLALSHWYSHFPHVFLAFPYTHENRHCSQKNTPPADFIVCKLTLLVASNGLTDNQNRHADGCKRPTMRALSPAQRESWWVCCVHKLQYATLYQQQYPPWHLRSMCSRHHPPKIVRLYKMRAVSCAVFRVQRYTAVSIVHRACRPAMHRTRHRPCVLR